jgi:tRNA modification GTPase
MLIVDKILETLFALGARAAEPGEFTKRAFLNGKLDLIQAEAVCDLIHARSELQRKIAQEQLKGTLSKRIQRLADEVLSILEVVEANIDFIEEEIDTFDRNNAINQLNQQKNALKRLLDGAPFSKPFREGYNVVISGPVNAGKSSLFNRIVGERRAIVTDIPGTTRDVIREPRIIDGLVFILQDTAGLRGLAADVVEAIGLGRAEQAARAADLVVFVLDASEPITDATKERMIHLDPGRTLVVLNKKDLPQVLSKDDIESIKPGLPVMSISATTGEGTEALEQAVIDSTGREPLSWIARERIVLNSRLISLLEAARQQTNALEASIRAGNPLEILAVEIRELLGSYEEATGQKYSDHLLDNIFSRFCIGK